MSRYELTQAEYLAVMGTIPVLLSEQMEQVSWSDATNHCGKLTASERAAGVTQGGSIGCRGSGWEYACRAGTRLSLRTGPAVGDSHFRWLPEYIGGTGTVSMKNQMGFIWLRRRW